MHELAEARESRISASKGDLIDVSPDNHPMDDIAVVFTKGDRDAILEIRDTLRELRTGLENFDPSTLMALLIGGAPGNPMGSILGSFIK